MQKYFLLLLLLLLGAMGFNATPIDAAVIKRPTVANLTLIGDKVYYIEESLSVNWFHAGNLCRQLNGFLVNLESEQELLALSAHLHPAKSYWLSLYELAIPGVYASQATGKDAQFLRWSAGQPDNIGGVEHCVELWRASSSFQMNDAPCETSLHFICELETESD
ncbi:C-type lectin 37Db isoform X1 [Drosophila hydei]|uniref:C-type lectin 37Db isoform X1 n=1 Tax=Drosophila hydei TaxID=7224 RepID=A0A6J1L9A3_DROHY|nr:C-type lectin 37Db isoform X1 [Drosophila hydei]